MSTPVETAPETTEATPQGTPVEDTGGTGISDLGSGFLKGVSELERPIVEKYVKDWDAQVTKRFQDVHSEYADYKPFKDAGYDGNALAEAVQLVEALNNNPQELVPALAEAYGVKYAKEVAAELDRQSEQGAGTQQQGAESTGSDSDLRAMVETMAQILLSQKQEQEQSVMEAQLDRDINTVLEKNKDKGPFDEKYVLSQCLTRGISLEDAANEFYAFKDSLIGGGKSATPAPMILGANGGLPAEGTNLGSLDSKATRSLVQQMLDNAKRET